MLNIMGNKVFSIGDIGTEDKNNYQIIKKINEKDNIFQKFFFIKGKLVGGILINDISLAGKLKKLIILEEDYTELLRKDISQEEKIKLL